MKKKLPFVLAFLCSIYCVQAQSEKPQAPPLPKAILKLSPLHFFDGTFQFGTEVFGASRSRSFNLDVGVRTNSANYTDVTGFTAELGYRKYVRPMELRQRNGKDFYQGIYYNLFLQGGYFTGEGDANYYSAAPSQKYTLTTNSVSPGIYFGLQKTIWDVMFLDFYFGGGLRLTTYQLSASTTGDSIDDSNILDPAYRGVFPKIGLKVGIGL